MLANDKALHSVVVGDEGFAEQLGMAGLHISMSTVSPETSRQLAAEHAKHGSEFLCAPVLGRPNAAAARKLWVCQSGSERAKRRAQPILAALGQGTQDFGEDPGAANVVKLTGNGYSVQIFNGKPMSSVLIMGVGGAGGGLAWDVSQAVVDSRMVGMNTDRKSLEKSAFPEKVVLGAEACRGLPTNVPARGRRG